MPPKKKPVTAGNAVVSTSNSTIPTTVNGLTAATTTTPPTTTTNTNNNNNNNTTTTTTSNAPKKIQWYWAGDSAPGQQQDILVEYDSKTNSEIESQYQMHCLKPKIKKYLTYKVDKDRHIDFKKMVQARNDDPSKMRNVERKEIIAGAPPPSTTSGENLKKRRKLAKNISSDSSDSDSSSDDSDSDSSSSDDDSDDEDYIAKWFWAGDSNGGPAKGGGHQDVWVPYDLKMCKKLESSFQKNKKKYKVDDERFVDFQNMLQRRYDDENKRRNLKRDDPLKTKTKKSTLTKAQQINIATTAMANTHTPSTSTTSTAPVTRASSKNLSTTTTTAPTTTTTTTAATSDTSQQQQQQQLPRTLAPTTSMVSIASIIKCPKTWTDVDSMDYKEIDVKPHESEFKWMSNLFTQTISSNHKGTTTLSPIVFNDLKVTRVTRVQNPMLWVSYHARKQKILDDNKGLCPPIKHVITDIPNGPETDTKANEFFLFHGLNVSSITGIAKFGFDPRFCSLDGMFGAGLYFAENSSKSNQYCHAGACTCSGFQATSCRCSPKDEVCLLVCRVVMGDSLVENVFRGNGPNQFWHGRRTEPSKPGGGIYNSVIGESKINYGSKAALQLREYIVYESSQVFVEYKVHFKRVK